MSHPYLSKDADVGCHHLCMIQGQPRRSDDEAMAKFLDEMKVKQFMTPKSSTTIDPSKIWMLVK